MRKSPVLFVLLGFWLANAPALAGNRATAPERPSAAQISARRWFKPLPADRMLRGRLGAALFLLLGPNAPTVPGKVAPAEGRMLFAHRGGSHGPENTRPTYQRAHELGFHLEGDLQLTSDREVVVMHDDDGLRTTGINKRVASVSLKEVQAWDAGYGWTDSHGVRRFENRGFVVPTLDEMLAAFPEARWNFDIKSRDPFMVDRVLGILRNHQAEQRVTLASFSTRTMLEVRARGFAGLTALSIPELIATLTPSLYRRLPLRGEIAQFPLTWRGRSLATPRLIDRCHACGLRVHFWDVDTIDAARELATLGADILETNHPEILAPLLGAHRKAQ